MTEDSVAENGTKISGFFLPWTGLHVTHLKREHRVLDNGTDYLTHLSTRIEERSNVNHSSLRAGGFVLHYYSGLNDTAW
jgi:hypothetical protein